MLVTEIPDEIRICTWCTQPFEPTLQHFAPRRTGRYKLMTVCRTCSKHDGKLRAKYRSQYDDPQICACGYEGKLEVDHDHTTYPYAFIDYKCRSCNLKAREPYVRGPSSSRKSILKNMGFAKQWHIYCQNKLAGIDARDAETLAWVDDLEAEALAGYEEAQSRCRLSMLCKATMRPLSYPLFARLVEFSALELENKKEFREKCAQVK